MGSKTIVPKISFESTANISELSNKTGNAPFCTPWKMVYGTLFIIMISLAICVLKIKTEEDFQIEKITGGKEAYKRFARDLLRIKDEFPAQHSKVWSSLSG